MQFAICNCIFFKQLCIPFTLIGLPYYFGNRVAKKINSFRNILYFMSKHARIKYKILYLINYWFFNNLL